MPSIRQVLVSTVVFAMLPTTLLKGASSIVEYIGGTVKIDSAEYRGFHQR